jgi:Transglutaminase-like superfamily
MSASYFLSPHVHVCVAGKQVVLLDLERDKYLSMAHTHPIGRWVRGWPVPPPDSTATDAENGLLAKMIAQGLLVKDASTGKEASPAVAEPPKLAMIEHDLNTRPRTTLAQLWHVSTAYTTAKWALKRRPIKEVVQAIRLRKKAGGVSTSTLDPGAVRPLVTAFAHLRPLFYTAKDACLLDSLTLVNFLASYDFFPQWVFGVKTDPFYAHCWVQQHDFVFNDTPDYVRGFSPILVV